MKRKTYKKLCTIVHESREHGSPLFKLALEFPKRIKGKICIQHGYLNTFGKPSVFVDRAACFVSADFARNFAVRHGYSAQG